MKAFPDATHAWSVINTASMDIEEDTCWCMLRLTRGRPLAYEAMLNTLIEGDRSRLCDPTSTCEQDLDLSFRGIPMNVVISTNPKESFIECRTPFTVATVTPEPPRWFGQYWELMRTLARMGEFRIATVGPEGGCDPRDWPEGIEGTLIIWQSDETDHVDLARPE